MKNTVGRLWIIAVALISGGLWTLFHYCTGTTGFNFSWPVDSSKFNMDMTVIGTAVWIGALLLAIGLLIVALALALTIVMQFVPERAPSYEDPSARRGILSLTE